VASSLLSKDGGANYAAEIRAEYEKIATGHANQRAGGKRLAIAEARANAAKLDFTDYKPPAPSFMGSRIYTQYDLAELAKYIDWGPFFQTWELAGPFPAILEDDKVGQAARDLYRDAQAMLKKIIDGKVADRQRRDRLLARQPRSQKSRRHYRLWRQGAEIPDPDLAHLAPADGARAGPAQSGAG
jgi:cobalamin-dependent methionine synthase I